MIEFLSWTWFEISYKTNQVRNKNTFDNVIKVIV